MTHPTRRALLGGALATLGAAGLSSLAGCSLERASSAPTPHLRLGYFASLTHAVPMTAVARGTVARHLGSSVALETQVFDAGPAAVESLLAGAIDAAYLGPSPAINAHVRTKRRGIRIVAGAATGGAALVVRPGITSVKQLRGRVIATPQLGGTQDVALRTWLWNHGLRTELTGSTDVNIVSQANSQTLDLFKAGTIDGAWLPEPWVSRLVLDAGATVLVDERAMWPRGVFPTTVLVVMQDYLEAYPERVRSLLDAHVETVTAMRADAETARVFVNTEIDRLVGKPLKPAVLERAWKQLDIGWDPIASAMPRLAADSVTACITPRLPDLTGLLDLRPLNKVLAAHGHAPVFDAGLGVS